MRASSNRCLLAQVILASCALSAGTRTAWGEEAARNVAPEATVTASTRPAAAAAVADGLLPGPGNRDDGRSVWCIKEAKELPASLVFTWKEPVTVSTVVYYGRSRAWGFQVFKDYAVYLDDAEKPVVEGAFRNGHGPQPVTLPAPVRLRKLRLEFRSQHGGEPGATEVQIFSKPPAQEELLGHFTDLKRDFRYAYYPSHNLVRIYLPQPPADATDWRLALRPEKGGTALAERTGKLPMAAGGEAMPVPDLPEGDYVLALTLTGGAQPIVEERHIRRDRPEWEGHKLGREDIVIPPFTPLAVEADGQVVRSVLRSHTHGEAGLWTQVQSQGRDLLAAPVRLEVIRGNTIHKAGGKPPRIVEATKTRVSGEADWTAGALSGTTRFVYDYDGLKTITLKLSPTETEIDRVQLVIPLRAAEAWLMHPVTTGLRQHYAGRIPTLSPAEGPTMPKGAVPGGRVWESSKVPDRLNGVFVPYIYLGGPERGICFAADNDRDWITDPNTPMMTLDRQGDTVVLRLNLIARPARLTRERTITFSLQATPAKPMPEQPYNWRRWWANTGTNRDVEDVGIGFWGGNGYWGGRHFATSVFPDGKDYTFWEKLAEQRRTGKLDKEYEQQWFARYSDLSAKQRGEFEPAMRAGFQWSSFTPANGPETTKYHYVIPYTNARGASFETPEFLTTYIDEWLSGDIVDPRWHNYSTFERPRRVHTEFPGFACWYQVEPVPSRIDMLLFYHKKMLETFADGIYWDNFFLQPNYAPAGAGGPGYVDDDGRPRAGVNLMGFRELVKRTATMMHVMGKRPMTYIHMTNVNVVPMLSFGTVNLDWEWRDQGNYASMDLQDRMDLDLILAHNLGLQAGNLSVGITGNILKGGGGVSREWLHRTGMAVCFPHEIRMHAGDQAVSLVQTQLARFGYGLPNCRVFRYWEDGFPLRSEGAEMRALVLARGGKAMIAMGNYGPSKAGGDANATQPRDAPSLEDYDAGQRGVKEPADQAKPAAPADKDETYTVKLTLDLKALGLGENAKAYDAEVRAGRPKAAPGEAKEPPLKKAPASAPPAGELKRLAPGVFELPIVRNDFVLIAVE